MFLKSIMLLVIILPVLFALYLVIRLGIQGDSYNSNSVVSRLYKLFRIKK